MALEELLRVVREEAAREERAIAERGAAEAARIVAEARAATARVGEAALAREEAARAGRLRAAREAAALARDRALLAEGRRQLGRLRGLAEERLARECSGDDLDRWIEELLREAEPVGAILVVDPGAAPGAARSLARLGAAGIEVREADRPRGGAELVTGSLVLDDTLGARLERAWTRAEPELAALLFAEG